MLYVIEFIGMVITVLIYVLANIVSVFTRCCFVYYGDIYNKVKFINISYQRLIPNNCINGLFKIEDIVPNSPKHHLWLIYNYTFNKSANI